MSQGKPATQARPAAGGAVMNAGQAPARPTPSAGRYRDGPHAPGVLAAAPVPGSGERRSLARSYPGDPGQVRLVRAALAPLLDGCPAADDAILISSELAANAAVHSRSAAPGGLFTVRAEVYPGEYVWIEVEDQGGSWTRGQHDDDRPHGLDLVEALAGTGNWGIDGDSDHGRSVWVRLDWPQEPAPP